MKSNRHNISITNERVEEELLKSQNMSKYIENAILFYIQEHEKHYVEHDEFAKLERKVEVIKDTLTNVLDGIICKNK